MPPVRTVLVLRALGLGDLCTGVPALRALRRAYPDSDLVLAAPAWQEPLAMLAGVDRVVDTAPLATIDPSLHGADLAVNLHGRGPQSTSLLAATQPRRLVAFDHPSVAVDLVADVRWQAAEHEVHRWCRLLSESGIPADPADIHLPALPSRQVGRRATDRFAVVHPGAAAPGRRWPAERFGAVVGALAGRGEHVVVTGSADERPLCEAVVAAAGRDVRHSVDIVAGETSLMDLAAVVAASSLVVANDTGVAHLATAFDVTSVVLFGPTPPAEWGPPAGGRHSALWAGRRGDPHGTELDPGLAQITVARVLDAVAEVTRRVPA